LWEVASGREVHRIEGHTKAVTGIAFSPDDWLLASGSYDGTMRLWEVASGREVRRLEDVTRGVGGPALSPDGRLLAFSFAQELMVLGLR
jgi:WD40 repeat protein